MIEVSIIIVNWNGKKFLKELFEALAAQDFPKSKTEIIMVDNGSTRDDSVSYTKERFPWVKVLETGRNNGFARGNNIGMRAAQGKYIVLLNNDTIVHPSWLTQLVKAAESTGAGAVVPKLMYARQPGIINNAGSELNPKNPWPIQERGINQKDVGQFDSAETVTAFCGAAVLLRRDMLKKIGLFDESFFMYWEDSDLSWRGQKAGYTYSYNPKSIVDHIHTGTSTEHSPLFTFYVSRNRLLMLWKHASIKLALRSTLASTKEWLVRPLIASIKDFIKRRPHQGQIMLGLKILTSFWLNLPRALALRWHIIKEAGLN